MILPTMTLPELAAELQKDYKEVAARWKVFRPKFEKMRKRQTHFPWLWETNVQTKRNNNWYIGYYAFSKKDATCIWPQISIYFRYEKSTWAAFPINTPEKTLLLIFTSHFFERYIGRFLKSSRQEINYPIKNIAQYFFLKNYHINLYKPEIENSIRGFCEEGMFLGDWLSETYGLVKTYLSRNELKVNQYTEYFDFIQAEIVSDLFMSHNRCSLTNEKEENLSDEYYSSSVWRDFLFRRKNPIWDELLLDCMTFHKEHLEEYNQISHMLDSIAENRKELI